MTSLRHLKEIADDDVATKLLALINGELDPCEVSDRADDYYRACYTTPDNDDVVLVAADELLETCGVEGWASSDGRRGVSYCNTGDPYVKTLALVSGRFMVTSFEHLATKYPLTGN